MEAAVLLGVLLAAALAAEAAVLQLGSGRETWTTGIQYPLIHAHINDALVFKYDRGEHNVAQVWEPSCNLTDARQLAGVTESPFTLKFNHTGIFYYVCTIPGHCKAGMLLSVEVTGGEAPAPAPDAGVVVTSVPMPGNMKPSTQGSSACAPPVLVQGTNSTFHVSCLGPGIPLRPGQIANDFYTVANPYPDEVVAVISQQSQIVDADGRQVPLSEVYCHHFFGSSSLIAGEGAEIRGSMDRAPLLPPYYNIINGSYYADPSTRLVNIHIINTIGVADYNLAPCIECWCRDPADQARDFHGGTACCTPLNCQSSLSNHTAAVYKLQYNVTYRYGHGIEDAIQVHPQLLDVADGNVEYDVHRGEPGSVDVKTFITSIDARCPQTAPFGVMRCLGHQHIGGICMELYDTISRALICNSCAMYGTSSSVADPGHEHGYLVKMTDDTIIPPYQLQPGQNVTLVSHYDSSVDHFGVMALYIPLLVDWDPSCPGKGAIPATSQGAGNIFDTFLAAQGSLVPNSPSYR